MADYSSRTITAVTYEVTLPNPTNTVELEKALAHARNEWKAMYGGDDLHDDTFKVIANEERICIQWAGPVAIEGGIA